MRSYMWFINGDVTMFQSIKTQIERARLMVEVKDFHILSRFVGTFEGLPVYEDDKVIFAFCGVEPHFPGALLTENGKVVINATFLQLDARIQKAILMHEKGHQVYKHKSSTWNTMGAALGFGKGLKNEFIADEYALGRETEILEALEILLELYPKHRSLKLRIENLRNKTK